MAQPMFAASLADQVSAANLAAVSNTNMFLKGETS